MEINCRESNKRSANQDISGLCEVQSLTVKIIQFLLSRYFNIVLLEPLYKNKQVFVALMNNFFEARSFFINFANYFGDIFYRNDARLWITGSAPHVFFSDNLGLMILALFHFSSFNIDGSNAGLRNNSVKSPLLLLKLGDHRSPHTEAVQNTKYLPLSAPHFYLILNPALTSLQVFLKQL